MTMPRTDTINRLRTAFARLTEETGKVPAKTAVARAAGTSANTAEMYWDEITGEADHMKPAQIVIPARRRCLSCSTGFSSSWAGNRVCGTCRDREAWRSGVPEYSTASF
jgi:hypothetical protein